MISQLGGVAGIGVGTAIRETPDFSGKQVTGDHADAA
jgi:hypothetical protein